MEETKQELLTKKAVDDLMDRWLNDPSFAHQLKADPKAALQRCGLQPSENLVKSLRAVGPNISVQELRRRVSKGIWQN